MLPVEIENKLEDIRAQVVSFGAELVEIDCQRSGGRKTLLVTVDKSGGVTLQDCVHISQKLSFYMDELSNLGSLEAGFFREPYFLEVRSPGLDRPLVTQNDFLKALGQTLRVSFKNETGKSYTELGQLISVQNDQIEIRKSRDNSLLLLPIGSIVKAVREIQFGGLKK